MQPCKLLPAGSFSIIMSNRCLPTDPLTGSVLRMQRGGWAAGSSGCGCWDLLRAAAGCRCSPGSPSLRRRTGRCRRLVPGRLRQHLHATEERELAFQMTNKKEKISGVVGVPCLMRSSRTSAWLYSAAMPRGVTPCWSVCETRPPFCNRSSMT